MKWTVRFLAMGILLMIGLESIAQTANRDYEQGYAVYYADYFQGRKTANGEFYSTQEFTCAHRKHPFGTLLRVTRLDNNNTVVVRVNDRGPFGEGLVVDLSRAAAERIDLIRDGKTRVRLEVIGVSSSNPKNGVVGTTSTTRTTYNQQIRRDVPTGYGNTGSNPTRNNQRITNRNTDNRNLGEAVNERLSNGNVDIPSSYGEPTASGPAPKVVLGSIVVQLGAYANLRNATRQLNDLTAKGVANIYIVETRRSGKILNRVIMGPYDSERAAEQIVTGLKDQHSVAAVVTRL